MIGYTGYEAFCQREKIMTQARLAEGSNRWCYAAILWRRVGEIEEAEGCETIAAACANGLAIQLEDNNPVVIKLQA